MLVQTSTTSKPNNLLKKKTSISDEQFTEFVANSSKSRCFDYYEKEGKMPSDQMRKAIYKKCLDLVSSEYRVKGTRSGHINHAPVKIQDAYADAKKLIENLTWTTNGVEYSISLLAKKVVTEKVEA